MRRETWLLSVDCLPGVILLFDSSSWYDGIFEHTDWLFPTSRVQTEKHQMYHHSKWLQRINLTLSSPKRIPSACQTRDTRTKSISQLCQTQRLTERGPYTAERVEDFQGKMTTLKTCLHTKSCHRYWLFCTRHHWIAGEYKQSEKTTGLYTSI